MSSPAGTPLSRSRSPSSSLGQTQETAPRPSAQRERRKEESEAAIRAGGRRVAPSRLCLSSIQKRRRLPRGMKKAAEALSSSPRSATIFPFLSTCCGPHSSLFRTLASRTRRLEGSVLSFSEPRFSSARASYLAAVVSLFDGMTFSFSFSLFLLHSFSLRPSLTSVLMRVSLGGSCSCAFHASPPGAAAASVEAISCEREPRVFFFGVCRRRARKVGLAAGVFFFGVQGAGGVARPGAC